MRCSTKRVPQSGAGSVRSLYFQLTPANKSLAGTAMRSEAAGVLGRIHPGGTAHARRAARSGWLRGAGHDLMK